MMEITCPLLLLLFGLLALLPRGGRLAGRGEECLVIEGSMVTGGSVSMALGLLDLGDCAIGLLILGVTVRLGGSDSPWKDRLLKPVRGAAAGGRGSWGGVAVCTILPWWLPQDCATLEPCASSRTKITFSKLDRRIPKGFSQTMSGVMDWTLARSSAKNK